MVSALKAFAGAGITFVIGLALQMSGLQSTWGAGFFFGVAAFWGIVALFRNKRLVRRFPSITDWLPFLDEDAQSLPRDLTANYIKGHTFRLCDVALDGLLIDRTFEDCRILGPGAVVAVEAGMIVGCRFRTPPAGLQSIVLEVPGFRITHGLIVAQGCVFRRCTFEGLTFIGPPGFGQMLAAGTSDMK